MIPGQEFPMNNNLSGLKAVSRYFYDTCRRFPSRPAQRYNADLYHGDNNGRFTYDEMRERVEEISCGLLGMGIGRQDLVGLISRTSPYWTQVDMAVCCCAAVSVAVNPALSAGDAFRILGDSGVRFLFVDTEENLKKLLPRPGDLPKLEKIIVMDLSCSSNESNILGLRELMDRGRAWRRSNPGLFEERLSGITLDDWFTVQYDEGATGGSRGVILTHRCVSSRMEGVNEFFTRHGMEITRDDVTLCHQPLCRIFERCTCGLPAICHGACIAYADSPDTLLQDMRRYSPTWINGGPGPQKKMLTAFQGKMAGGLLKKMLFGLAVKVGTEALDYRRDHRNCYNMSPSYELEARLPLPLKIRYRLADRLLSRVRLLLGKRLRFTLSAG
jgi:long-chain acyl-CoA synthetase